MSLYACVCYFMVACYISIAEGKFTLTEIYSPETLFCEAYGHSLLCSTTFSEILVLVQKHHPLDFSDHFQAAESCVSIFFYYY